MSASQPLPFLLRSLYHNIKLNVRKRYAGMEINMSDTTNLGEGSIGSLLAKLAVPAVVAQVVNLLYNIVDRIYIGHIPGIGASALTGVGLFTPILMLINAFAMLAGSGGAPRAAIYMGKKDNETAQKIMGNCFSFLMICAVALTVIFYAAAPTLLVWFGASSATLTYAVFICKNIYTGKYICCYCIRHESFYNNAGLCKDKYAYNSDWSGY